MMSRYLLLLLIPITLFFSGCEKDTPSPSPVTDVCLLPNGFIKWNDNHGSYCATTAFADEAIVLTMNGVSLNGPTITLELTEYSAGTHPITDNINNIFYTSALGLSYLSNNSHPGTLNITSYSPSNHQIKGNFQCMVYDPAGIAAPLSLSGSFSMYYTF